MPTAAPIPVFHASAQFAFPYHYVPAPAVVDEQPKNRKFKITKQNSSASVRKKGF
jgi:hypothetical protein